jgi:hypothetical protein
VACEITMCQGHLALNSHFLERANDNLPRGTHLEAARNSKGWFVMTIFEINFVHVNEQPYVIVFGTPMSATVARVDLDSLARGH